jgi:hypothetical protein
VKFSCLGAAAALSLAINKPDGSTVASPALSDLYSRVEQGSSGVKRLSPSCYFSLEKRKMVEDLTDMVDELNQEAGKLLKAVQEMLLSGGDIESSKTAAEATFSVMAKLLASLRGAKIKQNKEES